MYAHWEEIAEYFVGKCANFIDSKSEKLGGGGEPGISFSSLTHSDSS